MLEQMSVRAEGGACRAVADVPYSDYHGVMDSWLDYRRCEMNTSPKAKVCRVVRGGVSYTSQQGSVHAPGISKETVGSEVLYLGVVSLPPGERTKAHIHERHDTAHYMLSGDEIEFYTGEELDDRKVAHPGDYIFTPAGVPHVAVNRSTTPAVFVVARNEPAAQESVVMCPELDAKVP